jgi:hypothetical protein
LKPIACKNELLAKENNTTFLARDGLLTQHSKIPENGLKNDQKWAKMVGDEFGYVERLGNG